jgi:hypothetical protein
MRLRIVSAVMSSSRSNILCPVARDALVAPARRA